MNTELNKLLGRDFLIGFLLPSLVFLVTTSLSWSHAGQPLAWLKLNPEDPFKETAVLAMVAFALAVLLQAINRELFRLLEGYWPPRLRKPLSQYQQKCFRELHCKVADLMAARAAHDTEDSGTPFPQRAELIELSEQAAGRFPSEESLVLPTTFGNTARAYEDYPRVMYGFESIGGWARIQTVISKQAADLLSKVRGRVDLWLNLFFLTWVILVEEFWLAWNYQKTELLLLVVGGLLFAAFAYSRARSSAERYGDQVKATYDVYLGDLCGKLGFKLSLDAEQNRKFWVAYSRAFVYRQPERIGELLKVGLERSNAKAPTSSDTTDED
jgi:hypothetical protein